MEPITYLQERNEELSRILKNLPKIPTTVKYNDGFSKGNYSFKNYNDNNVFTIKVYGCSYSVDFEVIKDEHRHLLKYLLFHWISSDLTANTAYKYFAALRDMEPSRLTNIILAGPQEIKLEWTLLFAGDYTPSVYNAIRSMLSFFCNFNLAGWSKPYLHFIRSALPAPFKDKYAGIRNGDSFLSAHEESLIVGYLDDISHRITSWPDIVKYSELEPACMLMCSYLYGMRPLQVALLEMCDVRIWNGDPENNRTDVHLTFLMIKQRSQSNALPITRRVKDEWKVLIIELYTRMQDKGSSGEDKIFSAKSNTEAGAVISKLASKIVGCNVSALDLRHTAAQRLVDGGASQEEVAEFLGHSDITTCLVYFNSSPSQAERVNKAMGISAIYQQVVKIAHDKFISQNELAGLKEDQQIAGAPHGFAIAGIGGCTTGQPSCPFNPVTSCYSCPKFMPVTDLALHTRVLSDMRKVVRRFVDSGRGESNNPAYMQLTRTIASIQAVINEMESA